MKTWDLNSLDIKPHEPEVLASEQEGRVIAIQLPAGEALDEHQVHERAWLIVIEGAVEVSEPGGESVGAGAGLLAEFDPAERHVVHATQDARLLLILSPWPGVGHPSER